MKKRVIKNVLIPTDFSNLSLGALDYAKILMQFQSPKIYLLHVIDKGTSNKKGKKVNSRESFESREKTAMKQLNSIAGQHFSNAHIVTLAVRRGDPAKEIVKLAQEEKIDLIIISTHGLTGIAHVLLGSVAEKVVRYSPVPVLSVKPQKFQAKLVYESDIDEQLHLKPPKEKTKKHYE